MQKTEYFTGTNDHTDLRDAIGDANTFATFNNW